MNTPRPIDPETGEHVRRRAEDFPPHWTVALGKLLGRLIVAGFGMAIALWGIYDIAVSDRKFPPASSWHYAIMGGVIAVGLAVAGGKKTLDAFRAIAEWIKAFRGGGSNPPTT